DVTGEAIWLRCDAHQIVEALSSLIVKVAEDVGATTFALEALDDVPRPYVSLVFKGSPAHAERIDVGGDQVLPGLKPPLTLRDALKSHRSELQLREIGDGRVRLGFELLSPMEQHADLGAVSPIKPLDFYDFKLLERAAPGAADHNTPLRDATFVVFDTETTGLEPSKGDEIISIAGVRVVNGRILMGETFDTLVNPGRSIPARSTAVHGITDSMVKDALPISVQLKRFHRFVGDSILVAHNAPFDLRFLDLKEDVTGLRFDGPVLDTVLLSAIVHDHTDQHTLDAVAERFGVTLPPDKRHTALGDAMATADVFVRMIDLLQFNGITTLKQALEASERLQNIRRKQSKY
ncbi:MAG: exonuclease domain-containing protein, partial [Pseudomonadota bacterium]